MGDGGSETARADRLGHRVVADRRGDRRCLPLAAHAADAVVSVRLVPDEASVTTGATDGYTGDGHQTRAPTR